MNKSGVTPAQLAIRIVIIVVVLIILLLVSFSMIKLVPKVFSSIADIKNLLHKTATTTPNNTASSTVSTSTPATQTTQSNSSATTTYKAPINTSTTSNNGSISNLNVNFTNSRITNGKGMVVFNVTNTSDQNSGPWKFSATLPRSGNTTYNSPLQTNIPSGKTSVMTLNFDKAQKGTVTVTINGTPFTTQIN